MDNKTIAEKAKELVGQAETEEALRQLIAFLKTDPRLNALERTATEAQAQWINTKREVTAGRISFEQAELVYNRVNNQVLRIADDLEEGATSSALAAGSRVWYKNRIWIFAAGILVLLAAGFGITRLISGGTGAQGTPLPSNRCPDFSGKARFKILLWEYRAFLKSDAEAAKGVPVALQNRLNSFIKRDWPVETRIYTVSDSLPYPSQEDEALQCGVQLAIWGTTEKIAAQEWVVITSYAFAEKWQLSRWSLADGESWEKTEVTATLPLAGSFVDTISSLSSIFSQGKVAVNIESLLNIAIGLNATREQDQDGAIASLENVSTGDSTLALLSGMLLAENYSARGQEDKAMDSYQNVLSVHPNYGLALNNYAALQIKKGEFGEAIATLDNAVALAPDNTETLTMRGSAFLELNQLELAKRDFSKARDILDRKTTQETDALAIRSVDKQTRVLEAKFGVLAKRVAFEKQRKADAEQELRRNPGDVEALNTRAEASKNLGDYKAAIQSANAVIQQQPDNVKAHVTLVDALAAIGDTTKVKAALRRAENIGLEPADIKKQAPLIQSLPDSGLFRRRTN